MGERTKSKLHSVWFALGLLVVAVMLIPYLVLGQEAIFVYHDQLDGELIAYILQAKHLFDGGILPEFLSGADKTALTMPAPLFCLLFRVMSPFAALVTMQLVGSIVGYVGMYLLARESGCARWIAVMTAVLYAYLPFLPVYGLSQYGIPLLLWCLCQCRKNKYWMPALLYTLFYGMTSSLVLVGFGVLGLCLVWTLYEFHCSKKKAQKDIGARKMLVLWGAMLLVYVVENASLFLQLLGGNGNTVSHKSEYALQAGSFWDSLVEYVTQGGQHGEDFHQWIAIGVVLAVVVSVICLHIFEGTLPDAQRDGVRMREANRILRLIGLCLGINVCFAALAALWDSSVGVALRSHLQALGAFQMDRLLWMAPCFWYLMLACACNLLVIMLRRPKMMERLFLGLACGGMALALVVTAKNVLLGSNLKPNIQKMRNADYSAMSFNDYYAVGILEQVEEYIAEQTGRAKEQYKVASLGIDPAAALYHGFYCVDGYSNNYSLEYKHQFREIIAAELDKSAYLQAYFDEWGNRCYLFSAECPGYYTIEKGGFFFQNLNINVDKLQQMGCEYLFSAAYIQNAEEIGLELLRDESFETEDSYYQIYLYGLK